MKASLNSNFYFSKQDNAVAIHEGNAREALANLEGVTHQWLMWLETALGHLVGLEGVRFIHLLATSTLAHLPLQLGDVAGSATATHEANWRIANLDLAGDNEQMNLNIEFLVWPSMVLTRTP